jgi:diguanylate cyclase (GGDEF)-like protein/PAS domain S-box-containing protein
MSRQQRSFRRYAIAAASFAVAFIVWIELGIGGNTVTHVFNDVAGVMAAIAASAACIFAATRLAGRARYAWFLIAAGVAMWTAGEVLWVVYDLALGREMPFPSLADAGYLAFIPLTTAGLLALPSLGSATSRLRALLDVVVTVTSLLCLSWVLILAPVYRSPGTSVLARVIAIAYPLGDVAIASIVILVISRARRGARLHLVLLGGGLAILALADSAFTYLSTVAGYEPGALVDAGWVIAFLLIALAAISRATTPAESELPTRGRSLASAVLPYVAVPIVLTLIATQTILGRKLDDLLIYGALLLGAVLVVRQALTVRENAMLTNGLEEKVAQRTVQLAASEALSRSIIDTATDAFIALDDDGHIIEWSKQAEELLGWTRDRALDRPLQDLVVASDHREALQAGMKEFVLTGASRVFGQHLEVVARHRDGRSFPVELTMWGMLHDGVVRFNGFVHDISERKRLEAELRHQALHDALTGLPNRELFLDRLDQALERQERTGMRPSILFLDLDNFKTVNDSLGHGVGDRLLVAFAQRLREVVRPADTVARFGGDEFAVLLDEVSDPDEAEGASKRVIAAISMPFMVEGREIAVTASIGISSAGEETSADEMVRDADMAMYSAKLAGKDRYRIFEPHMHSVALDRLERETDLRAAVVRGEFVLLYQPIIDLQSGALKGAEALLRWNHPRRGTLPPSEFIELAEETGLIVPIGRWVLSEACRQLIAWDDEAGLTTDLSVSVNVSTLQFRHPGLLEHVAEAIDRSGVAPERLLLEITESVMLEDSERIVGLLQDLRRLGVRLAIDDFGTGYSSLGYLKRLPIDILKIDKTFIDGIASNAEDSALPHAIIKLAHTLQLGVTAEGVESDEQATRLRALGCEFGQGYFFSVPVPASEISRLRRDGEVQRATRADDLDAFATKVGGM